MPLDPPCRPDALRLLYERVDYERAASLPYDRWKLKLARMRELLDRLGNPHQRLAICHVAGTKGKGSTAAMIAAAMATSGHRAGLFTSPHLERVEERIAVDGRACSEEQFVRLVEQVAPAVQAMDRLAGPGESGPTFFEIATAMAFVHFVEQRVGVAVLEVGLGGRLDSTNVCRPLVAVITSISYDHTKQLGNTLEAIAREKAGIVKRQTPVVSGVTDPAPRDVIRQTSRRRRSPLIELGVDFEFSYRPPRDLHLAPTLGSLDFRWTDGRGPELRELPLSLVGRHQGTNAAVALAALGTLERAGWATPEAAVRQAFSSLRWPARVEVTARRPTVVVDAAHNLASIEALLEALDESFAPRRRSLVFATTLEKDLAGMLRRLLPAFDSVTLTQYLDNPRAVPAADLAAAAREISGRSYPAFARPLDAWHHARAQAEPDDLICITGSFFIAAQLRQAAQASGGG